MKRAILSVIIGLVIATIIFLLFASINSPLHPTPTILNYNDGNATKGFYENQPLTFWVIVVVGWFNGSFLCGALYQTD